MNKAGMTLVETVVSMSLLAFSFSFILPAVTTALSLQQAAIKEGILTDIIQSKFEQAYLLNFSDLPSLEIDKQVVNHTGAPESEGEYRVSISIASVNGGAFDPAGLGAEISVYGTRKNRKTNQFDLPEKEYKTWVIN